MSRLFFLTSHNRPKSWLVRWLGLLSPIDAKEVAAGIAPAKIGVNCALNTTQQIKTVLFFGLAWIGLAWLGLPKNLQKENCFYITSDSVAVLYCLPDMAMSLC